jgi:hypothetical protein
VQRGKEVSIFVLVAFAAASLVIFVSLRLDLRAIAGDGLPDVFGARCSNPASDRP